MNYNGCLEYYQAHFLLKKSFGYRNWMCILAQNMEEETLHREIWRCNIPVWYFSVNDAIQQRIVITDGDQVWLCGKYDLAKPWVPFNISCRINSFQYVSVVSCVVVLWRYWCIVHSNVDCFVTLLTLTETCQATNPIVTSRPDFTMSPFSTERVVDAIDQCLSSPCVEPYQLCIDGYRNYTCVCQPGYQTFPSCRIVQVPGRIACTKRVISSNVVSPLLPTR